MTKMAAVLTAIPAIYGYSPAAEEVHTVSDSDYLADDTLRAEQLARCRDNPGELGDTGNWRNASVADFKARLQRMDEALGG